MLPARSRSLSMPSTVWDTQVPRSSARIRSLPPTRILLEFKTRHDQEVVPKGKPDGWTRRVFIGIDAGSTTMKAALVGEDGQLLHTWYGNNNGDILGTAKVIMADFYNHIPAGCTIGHVTTTGYGEALPIEAPKADSGETRP